MVCKTTDQRDLYYEVHGNAQSTKTLVFLNGLTQATISWALVVPFFAAKYRILLLDFIFQGQSDKTGNWRDFNQHAADVVSLLDKENIKRAHIVGLSYGSLVAQHLAVLHPLRVDKLVLVSTFAHKTPYYEAVELAWWRALETGGYNLMIDIMLPSVLSENYFSNPLVPIQKMKEARKDRSQSAEAIFSLMQATKERKDYRKDLEQITAATLIIQGEQDHLLPVHLANEVHLAIKNSKLIVVRNAGHTLNLEHVPEVCKHINDFLNKIE
ncbi:MAG: alpha/beta hydrolase [bacterium]|nr:alpha/beta hydrolase [bacterium]